MTETQEDRMMVQRLGDGELICSACWARFYPGMKEPTMGWEAGECTFCPEPEPPKPAHTMTRDGRYASATDLIAESERTNASITVYAKDLDAAEAELVATWDDETDSTAIYDEHGEVEMYSVWGFKADEESDRATWSVDIVFDVEGAGDESAGMPVPDAEREAADLVKAEESMIAWIKYAQLVLRPKVIKYIGEARRQASTLRRSRGRDLWRQKRDARQYNRLSEWSMTQKQRIAELESVLGRILEDGSGSEQLHNLAEGALNPDPAPGQGVKRDAE
jgi:hypothetical protein